jgi:hypothetical protein
MNTMPAQPTNSTSDNHYVDAYTPPSSSSATPATSWSAPATPTAQSGSEPIVSTQQPQSPPVSSTPESSSQSETLEDQNIFFLLGVRDGTDQQKEAFLDELQQVIWEDFLEFDVKLLITSDEMTQLQELLNSQTEKDLEKQEKIVIFLEKLIPDLEDIMLEKALELKEEMVRERASGLRQYYAEKPEKLQRLGEAEQLMDAGKWYSAAHLMNSLLSA